uniref:Wings apart-like protein C-terminal domain-containing protein n=1 Tax=Kwoniella dejecticola CBS 10117 TaxID=1296121 RepID=A0A1A6A4P2_9TREE|nr:uncharacterized protein I303_04345 [Kwoniella dejecticola CBS 10117]OBR85018.1 hypothetical protein I303_04345 [Kwoniella dejecticola CBS 10117]
MAGSSSPLPSPPSGVMRSASLSAQKVYSRRAAVIRDKRKAEALAGDSDDDTDEDIDLSSETRASTKGKEKGRIAVEDGSPISKRTKQDLGPRRIRTSPRNISSASASVKATATTMFSSASRSPSPSPPPMKRSSSSTSSTRANALSSGVPMLRSRRNQIQAEKQKNKQQQEQAITPIVDIHPPSSSPPSPLPLPPDARAPSTPPRKTKTIFLSRSGDNTPHASPSSYENLFSTVSPSKEYFDGLPGKQVGGLPVSPGLGNGNGNAEGSRRLTRPGGMRRMLTKTQSMGALPDTPSKETDAGAVEDDSPKNAFGGSMQAIISPSQLPLSPNAPTTPTKLRSLLRTKSMPESPSRSSPKQEYTTNLDHNSNSADPSAHGAGGSGGRAKRTYGGKRSMLAEVSQVNLELANLSKADIGDEETETAPEVSYAELRKKYETDNEETQDGSGNLMAELLLARAPQAVSDMRSKGENRRFMDELSCLIEGIGDPNMGISFKRTSALDILRNMQDETWLAKLKICGQVDKVWDSLFQARGEESDIAMETICMLFLNTIQQSDSGLDNILQNDQDQIIDILLRNLKVTSGPLDSEKKGKVSNLVSHSNSDLLHVQPSTRLLASSTLDSICESESDADEYIIFDNPAILGKVVDSLRTEMKALGDRFDLYEKGLDLMPSNDPPDFDHIYHLLHISFLLISHSDESKEQLEQQRSEIAKIFVDILIAASVLVLNTEDEISLNVSRSIGQILQLFIVLSSSSPQWIKDAFSIRGASTALLRIILQRTRFIPRQAQLTSMSSEAEESQRTEVDAGVSEVEMEQPDTKLLERDFLCTIMVLLIQSVRGNEEIARILATTRMRSGCTGKFGCLRKCNCLDQYTFTEHLGEIYKKYHEDDEDIFAKAITGYLALIIINLISSTASTSSFPHNARKDIKKDVEALPGQTVKNKLEGLRTSLRGLLYEVHHSLKQILGKSTEDRGVIKNRIEDRDGEEDEDEDEDGKEDEMEMESIKRALGLLDRMISDAI